jgi:hypothetical protein
VGVPTTNNGLEAMNDHIKGLLGIQGKKVRLTPLQVCRNMTSAMRAISMRSSDPVPGDALAVEGTSTYATKKYVCAKAW